MIRETAFAKTDCLGNNIQEVSGGFDLTNFTLPDVGDKIDIWNRLVTFDKSTTLKELIGTKYDMLAHRIISTGVAEATPADVSFHAGVKEVVFKVNGKRKVYRSNGYKFWSRG
jgi:hypothetical protein